MRGGWLSLSCIPALIVPLFLSSRLHAAPDDVRAAIYEDLRVTTFMGAGFQFQEQRDRDVYQRTRSMSMQGEWAPVSWFSMYLRVPYTELTRTDQDRSFYWDHIRAGLKFQAGNDTIGFVGGLFGDLARGHNKVGDVPANYGTLEPYAGVYLEKNLFYITGAVRWNTETNPQFLEGVGENFRRTWLGEVSMGLRLRPVTFMLDARYHETYDPRDAIKKYLEVGPGIDWAVADGVHLTAAGVFYTASESKNRGAVLSLRKFID